MTNGKHPHKNPTSTATLKTDASRSAVKQTMGSAGTARPSDAKPDTKHPPRLT